MKEMKTRPVYNAYPADDTCLSIPLPPFSLSWPSFPWWHCQHSLFLTSNAITPSSLFATPSPGTPTFSGIRGIRGTVPFSKKYCCMLLTVTDVFYFPYFYSFFERFFEEKFSNKWQLPVAMGDMSFGQYSYNMPLSSFWLQHSPGC